MLSGNKTNEPAWILSDICKYLSFPVLWSKYPQVKVISGHRVKKVKPFLFISQPKKSGFRHAMHVFIKGGATNF